MNHVLERPPTLLTAAACAVAAGVIAAACSRSPAQAPEPEYRGVRVALVPTFTDLPPPSATITPLPSVTATAYYTTPTPDRFEAAGLPVRLEIPAIGVNATIEQVGTLPNGAIDVPKIPDNVAWYVESALPGQAGKSSVISGHLDSPYGPAVFYKLRMLVPGDELAVTFENRERHVFVVEGKERYFYEDVPLDKVSSSTPRRMLNLITCDGAWDRGQANYQQRLVVYTRLKESG